MTRLNSAALVRRTGPNTVAIADDETLQKIQKLLEMLEDFDDVTEVYHNAELPEEEEED